MVHMTVLTDWSATILASSTWFRFRPAASMSFRSSSGESLIPSLSSRGEPAADTTPPLMMELPPGVIIFSRTTTEAPAFFAS
jgi:hypothetical protein